METTGNSRQSVADYKNTYQCSSGEVLENSFSIIEKRVAISSNEWVNAEYKHLVVQVPDIALTARPGQFFHLRCPATGSDRPFFRRPMSVYRVVAAKGQIEFLYKVQGAGTRGLATLNGGDELDILGPLGNGFSLEQSLKHVLLLGRGVGLATLAPIAERVIEAGGKVTAVLSARSPDLIMSQVRLSEAGATVHCVTDTDQSSDVEAVEDLLETSHKIEPFDYLATCGSNRLMKMLQKFNQKHNIKAQVAMEQHMGCALGMCFACVIPVKNIDKLTYKRVCLDGPVFNLEEVLSWQA